MVVLKNKEIFDVKLAITTDCFFDCEYCFVKKDKKTMDFNTAKKALDLVMHCPPKNKIVRVYGGEPLMKFDLVEKISKYARSLEKKYRKSLTLTLCTNGFLLKKDYLDVLKKYGYRLAVSIDGEKKFHDKHRKMKNQKADIYEIVRGNILTALKNNSKRNMAAGLGVAPDNASNLQKNFKYLINLGFNTINIEPIHGFKKWSRRQIKVFYRQMKGVVDFIIEEIAGKNFIFLTTINRELKYQTLSEFRKGRCLFYQSMEICPDGDIGFSSFLINSPDREKYIIGNIHGGISKKYGKCEFARGSNRCLDCLVSYFDVEDKTLSEKVLAIRDLYSRKAAEFMKKMAKRDRNFADYIAAAKQHICF